MRVAAERVAMAESGARGKLEFLLELGEGGSKRELCAGGKDVVERIEDEVQQHFQLTDVVLADLSGDRPCKAGATSFILQRWSSKWNEYVDVTSNKAIEDKDKLKVVLKYSVSVVKEYFESHMKCVSSTA